MLQQRQAHLLQSTNALPGADLNTHLRTWMHVMQAMVRIAKHYRSRFTTVVGFAPTGWSHAQSRGKASLGKRRQKGTQITYQVIDPRIITARSSRQPAQTQLAL